MPCHQCGADLAATARACPACGAEHDDPARAEAPSEPARGGALLQLEPRFVPALQIAAHVPVFLFLALWGGFFFGGFTYVLLDAIDVVLPKWIPYVAFAAPIALVLPIRSYRATRRSYAALTYAFFPDRLEYGDGFFHVEPRSLPLTSITGARLTKGPLQRLHGLGTITLRVTPTAAGGRPRVRLLDLERPDEAYAGVRALLGLDRGEAAERQRHAA
jgi:membrane protein YdbS with pleckstrin-like domain